MTKSDVLSILDGLKKDYHDDHLVHANCDFYSGKILIETDPTAAREYFAAAEERFRNSSRQNTKCSAQYKAASPNSHEVSLRCQRCTLVGLVWTVRRA